jgi:hypothetical protein
MGCSSPLRGLDEEGKGGREGGREGGKELHRRTFCVGMHCVRWK